MSCVELSCVVVLCRLVLYSPLCILARKREEDRCHSLSVCRLAAVRDDPCETLSNPLLF